MAITAEGKRTMALENRLFKYLVPMGWERMDIGISLMYFEQTHGEKAGVALNAFIDWAEKHSKDAGWIAATLGHDLNGCRDETMLPRTSNYAKAV